MKKIILFLLFSMVCLAQNTDKSPYNLTTNGILLNTLEYNKEDLRVYITGFNSDTTNTDKSPYNLTSDAILGKSYRTTTNDLRVSIANISGDTIKISSYDTTISVDTSVVHKSGIDTIWAGTQWQLAEDFPFFDKFGNQTISSTEGRFNIAQSNDILIVDTMQLDLNYLTGDQLINVTPAHLHINSWDNGITLLSFDTTSYKITLTNLYGDNVLTFDSLATILYPVNFTSEAGFTPILNTEPDAWIKVYVNGVEGSVAWYRKP